MNLIVTASLVIFLATPQNSNARSLSDYTTLEKAQFATSLLRAPFGITQNLSSQATTSGKIAKLLASTVRLSDNILTMLNSGTNIYSGGWAVLDAFNIGSSIFEFAQDMPELEIDYQTEQSIMGYLNQAQKVLLSCAESAAAIMAAYYNNGETETAQDKINILRYQSLISLSRALSELIESEKNSNSAKIWAAILVANTLCSLYHWTIEKAPVAPAVPAAVLTPRAAAELNNLNNQIAGEQAILNNRNSTPQERIAALTRRNARALNYDTNIQYVRDAIREIDNLLSGQEPIPNDTSPFGLALQRQQLRGILQIAQTLQNRATECTTENQQFAHQIVHDQIQSQQIQNAQLDDNGIQLGNSQPIGETDCNICMESYDNLPEGSHIIRLCSNNHFMDQECYTSHLAQATHFRCPTCRENINHPQFYTLTRNNNQNQQGN